jgi:hypothetical protein
MTAKNTEKIGFELRLELIKVYVWLKVDHKSGYLGSRLNGSILKGQSLELLKLDGLASLQAYFAVNTSDMI